MVTSVSGYWRFGKTQPSQQHRGQRILFGCVIRRCRGIKPNHLEKILHSQIMALAHLVDRGLDHAYGAVSHNVGNLPADLRQVRCFALRLISPAKPPSLWLFPFALSLSSCCVLIPDIRRQKKGRALMRAHRLCSFSISKSRIANQLGRMGHALPQIYSLCAEALAGISLAIPLLTVFRPGNIGGGQSNQ